MSKDPMNAVPKLLQELIRQLDKKFQSVETRLERLQTQVENFRAFEERSKVQINQELVSLREELQEMRGAGLPVPSVSAQRPQIVDKPASPVQLTPKPDPQTSHAGRTPQSPLKVDAPSSAPQSPPAKQGKTPGPISSQPAASKKTARYVGLQATPLVVATDEPEEEVRITSRSEEFYEYQANKKKVKKQAIRAYLEKIEKAVEQSWSKVEGAYNDGDFPTFVDKGLTVLHGIIEFLFVAYRQEFPGQRLDYYAKAKNISSLGLFKDVSLLEKMESIASQLKSDENPALPRPLVRGWHERLRRVFQDYNSRINEAFARWR